MKAPHFWSAGLDPRSREAAPLTRLLLTPLAALYTFGIRRKLSRAKPESIPVRIVCVGNLTVGGVGKTPVVEAIRRRASEAGLRTASLSRGYGGKLEGPLKVDPDKHNSADVGEQQALIDDIKSKIRRYPQYNDDVSNWISFGATDPGDSGYRVPLSMMP